MQVYLDVLRAQYRVNVPEYTIMHVSTMQEERIADILGFVQRHYHAFLEPRICLLGVKRRGEDELALGPTVPIQTVACTSVSNTLHWGFYKTLEIVAMDLEPFVAFALGTHARCGRESVVRELNSDAMHVVFEVLKRSYVQS